MMRRNESEEGMPFSWEKKPGISKLSATTTTWVHQKRYKFPTDSEMEIGRRPVSSSSSEKVLSVEQQKVLKIPLPPCLVQPPYGRRSSRSSSIKGVVGPLGLGRQREDPFLAAYMECTKSVGNGNYCTSSRYPYNSNSIINNGEDGNKHKDKKIMRGCSSGSSLLRKSVFFFSCKHSCEVRDDSFVSLSHLPLPPPAPTSNRHLYNPTN